MHGNQALERNTTVLFVGTGAVENAWRPIFRALRRGASPELPDDVDLANLEMARIVHLVRFFHQRRPEQERSLLQALARVKAAMAEELHAAAASGEIKARASFLETLRRLKDQSRDVSIVSTNWDTSVNHAVQRIAPQFTVLQLHGSIDDAPNLYLASEMTTECYRTGPELKYHATTNRNAIEMVESATQLMVFGLSLSPLDAEVCQVLWAGREAAPALERVTVVDTKPELVARRLALVLGRSRLPPEGVIEQQPPDAGGVLPVPGDDGVVRPGSQRASRSRRRLRQRRRRPYTRANPNHLGRTAGAGKKSRANSATIPNCRAAAYGSTVQNPRIPESIQLGKEAAR